MRFKDYPKALQRKVGEVAVKSLNETVLRALRSELPRKTGRLARSVQVITLSDNTFAITAGTAFRRRRRYAPGVYGFINKSVRDKWIEVIDNSRKEISNKLQRNLNMEVK